MNVRQVLSIVHPFTRIYFETLTGSIIELKGIDPIDLEQVKRKSVLKVKATDYMEIVIVVGHLKITNFRR